jgi:hypothetical protein
VFVGVSVGVDVLVGVFVGSGVLVAVFVGVGVFVGVLVDVAVFVGEFVGVGVFVGELVGVGVFVAVAVGVGVLVGVGNSTVIVPLTTVTGIAPPVVVSSSTFDNVIALVPSATLLNVTVASVPVPFGPGFEPVSRHV